MGGDTLRRRSRKILCLAFGLTALLGAALVLLADPVRAETGTRIYRPQHRVAEELEAIAQAVLGDEGRVSVDGAGNALVLAGDVGAIEQTLDVLRQQDRAPAMLEVHYRALDFAQWSKAGYEIVADGASGGGVPAAGFALARVRKVVTKGERSGTRRIEGFTGVVRVASGSSVEITRGGAVPLVSRDVLGAHVAGVAEGRRGFRARPRLLEDGRVHLEIHYDDASVDAAGRVDGTSGHTSLTLATGETVAIGDLTGSTRSKQRAGRVWSTHDDRDERVYLLEVRRVRPMPAEVPRP
jgi:hypothetical protein